MGLKKLAHITKNFYEHKAWISHQYVCGFDEVGRGCLAGPLVVAAAIIPEKTDYALLKDSKELSEKERRKAACWIEKNCWYSIVAIDHTVIDKKNIYQATLLGMRKAFHALMISPNVSHDRLSSLVVDAMPLTLSFFSSARPIHFFPRAEKYSVSVAAASIIAKVTRDDMMQKIDEYFPGYGLKHHKGYGTKIHTDALKENGATIIHRKTFLKKIIGTSHEPFSQTVLFS